MKSKYILEKDVFTISDYEEMGWHDNYIHNFGFRYKDGHYFNLYFDIDYILKWNNPDPPEKFYSFWIAPSTLEFEQAFDLVIDIDGRGLGLEPLQISDLFLKDKYEQEPNRWVYNWYLDLQNGSIKFSSYGFSQLIREEPILSKNQMLNLNDRNGVLKRERVAPITK